jgi:hypothetical protein
MPHAFVILSSEKAVEQATLLRPLSMLGDTPSGQVFAVLECNVLSTVDPHYLHVRVRVDGVEGDLWIPHCDVLLIVTDAPGKILGFGLAAPRPAQTP